ncbi:hypothetical protein IEQ34_010083 [Dendrobium chrysotoxum]|uniref:C2 NT-type domain-containing protein n=1 Tax=Dendrobium chrysotoxum TaxID=161865 RepID=A0AAV7H3E6_DENCH|nr:hypothetical protein IEQ34_010083 [Dendrobium chrysotoxum]
MDFKLHLVVEHIEHLPVDSYDCNVIAKVEWRGNERKAGFLARGFERKYTSQQKVQEKGTVSWNEGFDHTCKFKRERSGIYRSWFIAIQIEEVQERGKMKNIGKAKVDVVEFISNFENDKSIRIPIDCSIGGHIAEAMLMVKLQLIKIEPKDRRRVTPTRARSLCFISRRPQLNSCRKTKSIQDSSTKTMKQKKRSFARLLSLSTKKLDQKVLSQPKGLPLLANGCAEDGDDIDNEWHHQSCIQFLTAFKKVKVRPEENLKPLGLKDNHKFEVGQWERKKLVSRDYKFELATEVFLASIDQRSKRAAGGSACTVLAAVIADWLHNNPKSLPLQCQFDELVLKGSLEWRNLCSEENHKVKFSDKHFDLDTVLEAKVRSLTIATEKSYVGFFSMDEMPEGFDWPQGEMSFDNIWNNILCTDVSEERIYIVSWNDHFFVLKVESDAIYLLDTLGERLSEGCNHAYILKFDAATSIYRHNKDDKESSSLDLVSEGIASCKEYIKGFLSAIPIRELQQDIKSERAKQELLHRLLQIDFHYTAPCTGKTD